MYHPNRSAQGVISPPASLPEQIDMQVIARMRAGEGSALSILYDRYARLVFSLAFRVLHDRDASEEAVQEVFLKVWRRSDDFDPYRGKFSTWVARIAHNHVIDEWRKNSHHPSIWELPDDELFAEDGLAVDESDSVWKHQMIVRALGQIPAPQRKVIELAYWEGLTQVEIAHMLDEPLGTVKTRMRRGLQKLKALLKQEE